MSRRDLTALSGFIIHRAAQSLRYWAATPLLYDDRILWHALRLSANAELKAALQLMLFCKLTSLSDYLSHALCMDTRVSLHTRVRKLSNRKVALRAGRNAIPI